MRTRNPTMSKSSSWPRAKTVVRKWLNLRNSEFHSDCCIGDESFGGHHQQQQQQQKVMRRRKSCSDNDGSSLLTRTDLSGGRLVESSENLRPPLPPPPRYGGSPAASSSSSWRPPKELRVFVGTWNVGGRAPHKGLDLSDWLIDSPASSSPHIYVLGFQEIVPLNAGNVLGAEDKGPAEQWLDLIRRALNSPSSSSSHKSGRVSFSDLLAAEDSRRLSTAVSDPDDEDDEDDMCSELSMTSNPESSSEEEGEASDFSAAPATTTRGRRRYYGGGYRLAASKQMVGILLCVWVRGDVAPGVAGLRASCVGRGVMGYMGNKGSVAVSLALRGGEAMCFVCTHLASGEKDGDEVRRNSDVAEILRRTRFSRSPPRPTAAAAWPETILEHDKVIWLGDLNYRLAGGEDEGTRALVERQEWAALLERDQLRAEQRAGRVFAGWEEGRIRFPPTYKYLAESDAYAMSLTTAASRPRPRPRDKKRTPAWCDRILWRGAGMQQHWYARGESRFSDHRPVGSLFTANMAGGKPRISMAATMPPCRSRSRSRAAASCPHSSRF